MVDLDAAQLTEEFAKMLIAQIQNQDPTNPMDPTQIVTQNAQMLASVGTARLSNQISHFEQVRVATQAIGKEIQYTDDLGNLKTGVVTAADFTQKDPFVWVGTDPVRMNNILLINEPTP